MEKRSLFSDPILDKMDLRNFVSNPNKCRVRKKNRTNQKMRTDPTELERVEPNEIKQYMREYKQTEKFGRKCKEFEQIK